MTPRIIGAVRIAVITEGAGESLGEVFLPPEPGDALWDELLGPAHILIARLIASFTPAAVNFVQPPRWKGRLAKGSDLLSRKALRQLLTWLDPVRRPHASVVLVDRDGDPGRPGALSANTMGIPLPHVIGVAVEAFESWIAVDETAPETLAAGEVKRRVTSDRSQRMATARTMDLPLQMTKSSSLRALHAELRRVIAPLLI